jgi:predicted cupin superfamily sugar epimerase
VHTLHGGRWRYVIIHADENGKEERVEVFVVGPDVATGERLQWIIDGGNMNRHSLPDEDGGKDSRGLLISETVPGFKFCDHDVLSPRGLQEVLGNEGAEELSWLSSPWGKK